ncbi:LysR substrate-binding domain-containing protein [Galactobacter sp.]|uniref:LysR family transcriptional regulator n=1 Tax=Galactobacter sp. TaxID=2676125 RepID=UPI0025BFD6C1|nr:LysR substrate-binding domain-containing protein [Galactobacter sp.]
MEIRWLDAFVAVAEELHFGRAAERLHMAQSPLSQVIRRLEKEVGTPLFHRSTRSVSLTASGSALLPYAYRALRTLNNAMDAARSADGEPAGRLRVGFSGVHNHHTLPKLTRALRREFPKVELTLVGGVRTFDGLRMVTNGELDATFMGIVNSVEDPLRARPISVQRLGLVLPGDHPLADRERVAVRELRNESFVMGPVDGNSSMTVMARQVCLAAGFAPDVAQAVSDPFLVLSMVAAGVGVTIVSSEVIPLLPENAVWVDLEDSIAPYVHGFAYSAENDSVPLAALIQVLDRVFPLEAFPVFARE